MIEIITSPLFYLFLTIGVYFLFAYLAKRFKTALFNPLLWTIVFIAGYILLIVAIGQSGFNEEAIAAATKRYQDAAGIFDFMLAPVTVALALPLYANRHVLKENWLAILVASLVGTGTSVATVYILGKVLQLDQGVTFALFPRGVTTAIAKEIVAILGATPFVAITVTIVALTGVVGAVLGPLLIKLFRDKNDIVVGLSLGSASHAIGTSKAFDYSEKAGAIATVSMITNGFVTVLVALIVSAIVH